MYDTINMVIINNEVMIAKFANDPSTHPHGY